MAADQPAHISIGTRKAFERGYQYEYSRQKPLGVYVCNKGSEWAREGEMLVLRHANDEWTAWDTAVVEDAFDCRQPVFKSTDNILEPGWHEWQIKYNANISNEKGAAVDWQDNNWQVETRHR